MISGLWDGTMMDVSWTAWVDGVTKTDDSWVVEIGYRCYECLVITIGADYAITWEDYAP